MSNDDFLSKKVEDLMPARFRPEHPSYRDRYMKAPQKLPMSNRKDLYILDSNQNEIPVDIALSPIEIAEETCVLCTVLDIRLKKESEARLEMQATHIQLIYEMTNIASDATNIDEALQNCIDCICGTLDMPIGHVLKYDNNKKALIPSNMWFLLDPEGMRAFKSVTQSLHFTKGMGLPGQVWAVKKPVWIRNMIEESNFPRASIAQEIGVHSAVAFPVVINNELIAVLEFFAYDIQAPNEAILHTFSIMAEQIGRIFERKEALLEQAEAEQYTKLLLEAAGEGIYGIDITGHTTFVNPATARLLGYTVDELIGQHMHEKVHYAYPDGKHYDSTDCKMYRAMHEGKIARVNDEVLWRKDGSPMWVEYICSPVYKGGEITGAVIVFNDISERKEAEEKLKAYSLELQESNRDLNDFAYIASHDLKEPLRGISNFSQFLLEDYAEKLGEDGRKQLETLVNLSSRLEALINTLLRYSRVGRISLTLDMASVQTIVEEKLNMLDHFIEENKATIKILTPLPEIVCDKELLGEVFQNLITNGIKYNDAQNRRININYTEDKNRHIFSISDNGIGIPREYHDKIFKIFKRLHGKGAYGGGSGAGMTIASKIVNKHHGEIWLDSQPRKGSTFYFSISKNLHPTREIDNESD